MTFCTFKANPSYMLQSISFSSGATNYYLNEPFKNIDTITKGREVVIVTDKNLFSHYGKQLEDYKVIVIPAGEANKSWEMVQQITEGMINHEVDKSHTLIGVGGGMITDITGFVAASYMRGLEFGFVPTSLLAMVDASIGGKNGVNIGVYKNMMGTIRQPGFILYDTDFLQTLPDEEWSSGFAEIIKYGCIFDKEVLIELEKHDLDFYKNDSEALQRLIRQCVLFKNKVVQEDEKELGMRKLLNFGHTVGHAIENNYGLAHGKSVSIGMVIAFSLSEKVSGLQQEATELLKHILERYRLPSALQADRHKVMQTLRMDKKRKADTIDFIILKELGKASIRKTTFEEIEEVLRAFWG